MGIDLLTHVQVDRGGVTWSIFPGPTTA